MKKKQKKDPGVHQRAHRSQNALADRKVIAEVAAKKTWEARWVRLGLFYAE